MISVGIVVAAAGALLAVAFWPGEREPEYQGKKLSEWLEMAWVRHARPSNAELAVLDIGTNSLPSLLKWINYSPPAWELRLSRYPANDLRGKLGRSLVQKDFVRFEHAIRGFDILGANAAPALPRLREIAQGQSGQQRAMVLALAEQIENRKDRAIPRW